MGRTPDRIAVFLLTPHSRGRGAMARLHLLAARPGREFYLMASVLLAPPTTFAQDIR